MTNLICRRTGVVALVLAVAACAHQPVATPRPPAPQEAAATPRYGPETLSDLLIAEVAAQRNLYDVTMGYYAREARQTRDPLVAEQAARLAHYLNDPVLAGEMGELWLDATKGSNAARELLALSYIEQGETGKAAALIDELMADNPEQALARLVLQAQGLDEEGNIQLLAALGSLTEQYPDQPALWYARALTLQAEGNPEAALKATDRALRLDRRHRESQLLKVRLLYDLDQKKDAFRYLERMLRKDPDAKRARVLYVRLLIQDRRLKEAGEQLDYLNELFPEDLDLRLSLALLAMEQGEREHATATLNDLLEQGYRSDEIHMYLAHAAELEGNQAEALEHYLSVQGENRLRARVQASRLMYLLERDQEAAGLMSQLRDRHPDQMPALYAAEADMLSRRGTPAEAMTLLNRALNDFPDNTELLYARAMTAERLDNLAQLEADLQRVLEIKPNDPTALNALGYTLAARTRRLDEAAEYIQAAYAQRPEDPAIIDSMGWLLYRQGQPDKALDYLQEAWKRLPDPEVAAHLGEVLWTLGQQQEARHIWRQGLEQSPDNKIIPETVLRLTGAPTP